MLTSSQKYNIATKMSCGSTKEHILVCMSAINATEAEIEEAKTWMDTVLKHLKKKDGYIPRKVIALLNKEEVL